MDDTQSPAAATDETVKAFPDGRVTISEAVKSGLSALAGRTRDAVVEHFAAKEAGKQAEALIKGLDKLNDLSREASKLSRPDIETFNGDGTSASVAFSKERIEQKKKLDEQIGKLTRAIDKADDKGDFGDLYNLVK